MSNSKIRQLLDNINTIEEEDKKLKEDLIIMFKKMEESKNKRNELQKQKEQLSSKVIREHKIIQINNTVNFNNTYLNNLPSELFRKILMNNLTTDLQNFNRHKQLKGSHWFTQIVNGVKVFEVKCQYSRNTQIYYDYNGNPNTYLPIHRLPNKKVMTYGKKRHLSKEHLIKHLNENNQKGFMSWSINKLIKACYSF